MTETTLKRSGESTFLVTEKFGSNQGGWDSRTIDTDECLRERFERL